MIVLEYTYQPSRSLDEANKQITNLVEELKSKLLAAATNENVEAVSVQASDADGKLAQVQAMVSENAAKVGMMAQFNEATGSISVSAALIDGIERSNIQLSADQIDISGCVKFNDLSTSGGTTINGANIQTGTITANKLSVDDLSAVSAKIGGWSIDRTYGLTSDGSAGIRQAHGTYYASLSSCQFKVGQTGNYESVLIAHDGVMVNKSDGTPTVLLNSSNPYIHAFGTIEGNEIKTNSSETTGGDDAGISATGYIRRKANGSSKRFKNSISYELTEDMNPEKLYDVSIVRFKYNTDYLTEKNDKRYDTPLIGFIAEDMDKKYPQACDYDEQGRPKGWNAHYIIPAMMKLLQEQNERIKVLENEK